MARFIKRGESLLIPFQNGVSIEDSQLRPKMYKSRKAFERAFPGSHSDGVELVEYTEVVHGVWFEYNTFMTCSVCDTDWYYVDNETDRFDYCPNCGANMKGE